MPPGFRFCTYRVQLAHQHHGAGLDTPPGPVLPGLDTIRRCWSTAAGTRARPGLGQLAHQGAGRVPAGVAVLHELQ